MPRAIRRVSTWLWIGGAVVTAAGLGAVFASVFADQSTVAGFARVPVGCVTTIAVNEATRLHVYVETRGRLDDVGECGNDDRSYEVEPRGDIGVMVIDGDGAVIDVEPIGERVAYDLPDYAGTSIGTVRLESGVPYRVQVESDDPSAVVAVGRRVVPVESGLAVAGAIVVMIGGTLVIAALVATWVTRRRRARGPWAPPDPADRAVF